ncbi:cupin domain-containing protein [Streptacidiphilus monticola]|uniref:Cupin domain-containing protein n=1 Tax=Streptacidiphilus monticola TaxID=2161674 RepID=A0ABW1FYA0_9ACTN
MPFVRAEQAETREIHGVRFTSYVRTATGSRDLAAWRGEVPALTPPTPAHVISEEEVFYVLAGRLRVSIDGEAAELAAGDAAVAPAGSALALDNPFAEPAQLWVTTRLGLSATMADGTVLFPEWAA